MKLEKPKTLVVVLMAWVHENEFVGRVEKRKKSREKNVLFLIVFASLSSANDLCWLGTWSHEFGFGFSSSLASAVIFSLPGQNEREEILFHKRFMLITWDVVLNNLTEFMLKFRFIFALSFLFSYLLYFSLPSHFHSRPTQSIVSQWQRARRKIVSAKCLDHTQERRKQELFNF